VINLDPDNQKFLNDEIRRIRSGQKIAAWLLLPWFFLFAAFIVVVLIGTIISQL